MFIVLMPGRGGVAATPEWLVDAGYAGQVSGTGSLFNLQLHARPLTGSRSCRAMDKREVENNAAMQQHLLGAGTLMGGIESLSLRWRRPSRAGRARA